MDNLPDLTPFINGSDWWNNDSTNALLLLSCDSNKFKNLCIETRIDEHLERLTK